MVKDGLIEIGIDIGAEPTLIQPTLSHDGGVEEDVIIVPGVRDAPRTNVCKGGGAEPWTALNVRLDGEANGGGATTFLVQVP